MRPTPIKNFIFNLLSVCGICAFGIGVCVFILTACRTITPVNVSHIDEVERDTEKIVVVKVIRFIKTEDKKIYVYAKADGKPIIIESGCEHARPTTGAEIERNRRYIFLLKRTQIQNLRHIRDELKISQKTKDIDCYSTETVDYTGYMSYISLNRNKE